MQTDGDGGVFLNQPQGGLGDGAAAAVKSEVVGIDLRNYRGVLFFRGFNNGHKRLPELLKVKCGDSVVLFLRVFQHAFRTIRT